MRISYGQGFRIYYTIVGQKIVLLLAGSTKQGQAKAIVKAAEYLAEANRRQRS
jgi:putative addiction module killer protein